MTTTFNRNLFFVLLLVSLIFIASVVLPKPDINIPVSSGGVTTTIEMNDSLALVNATILDVLSGHAWQGHGTEVNDAIRCLNNNGSTKSFQTFGFLDTNGKPIKTNMWLCRDGDDWYAIVTTTLEKVGGNRIGRLITAYLVDKKKFLLIEEFIDKAKTLWGAREISFTIEAGNVFLAPK